MPALLTFGDTSMKVQDLLNSMDIAINYAVFFSVKQDGEGVRGMGGTEG